MSHFFLENQADCIFLTLLQLIRLIVLAESGAVNVIQWYHPIGGYGVKVCDALNASREPGA